MSEHKIGSIKTTLLINNNLSQDAKINKLLHLTKISPNTAGGNLAASILYKYHENNIPKEELKSIIEQTNKYLNIYQIFSLINSEKHNIDDIKKISKYDINYVLDIFEHINERNNSSLLLKTVYLIDVFYQYYKEIEDVKISSFIKNLLEKLIEKRDQLFESDISIFNNFLEKKEA